MLASKSTSGQRCGFVWFQTRTAQEMAAAAIATLSDRHCPPGVDKPIQVSVAKNSAAAGRACGRDTSSHAAAALPSGGPPPGRIADGWPIGACGGLEAAAVPTTCLMSLPPPALGLPPPVAMGLPGVPCCGLNCGSAASPTSMPYVPPAAACDDAATPGGVGGIGVGVVGGVGGAPPWAPLPQITPHAPPPHAPPPHAPPPHDQPTAQENPAGSARMPVKLFVGSAARPDAPSWRPQSRPPPAPPRTACASPGSGPARLWAGAILGCSRHSRASRLMSCCSAACSANTARAAARRHSRRATSAPTGTDSRRACPSRQPARRRDDGRLAADLPALRPGWAHG